MHAFLEGLSYACYNWAVVHSLDGANVNKLFITSNLLLRHVWV